MKKLGEISKKKCQQNVYQIRIILTITVYKSEI